MDGEGRRVLGRPSYLIRDLYGFHADILHIRMPATGRLAWELILVSEFWRRGDRETLHSVKWLKLLSGKPTDVLKWIRTNSDVTP
jgi:hypothetical protein